MNTFGQIQLLLALYERLQSDVEESRTLNSSFRHPLPSAKAIFLNCTLPSLNSSTIISEYFWLFKKITPHQLEDTTHIEKAPSKPPEPAGDLGDTTSLLTSAWCSSFCCRTSITNSARRIVSSNFLAGVTNRPTFSVVQELKLKGRQNEKLDVQ